MKKLLFLLIVAGGSVSALAQGPTPRYHKDSLLSRWVIDVNLLGGLASQTFTTANTAANYPNALNVNTGDLKYNNGYAFGADAQLGFFFGKHRHFGFGAGFMYLEQHGDAELKNYHVEYQATDGAGNIFRQVVTGNTVKENLVAQSLNIPIVLKYKNRFSKHWGFTADAGAVIGLKTMNSYTTHAGFDYEAIYQFVSDAGGTKSVYDNSPIPNSNDWLITKAEFFKNNPNGNVQDYFNAKRAIGYSVGTGMAPDNRTGNSTTTDVTVGLLVQPSMNYFLSDHVALNFGVFYMLQPLANNAQANYRLTDGIGKYNSVNNSVNGGTNQTYGLNIGARFFLGGSHKPLVITSTDQNAPTHCGMCDGNIVLHGLPPGKSVAVNYTLNGTPQNAYPTTVTNDGQVKLDKLCAGSYTDIVATIKKQKAAGTPVTIVAPQLTIGSQNAVNPTVANTCNGYLTLGGLYENMTVNISYSLDGKPQPAFVGITKADKSIKIVGLCAGKYTDVVVKTNNCQANGTDFELAAPPAAAPPVTPTTINNETDISEPIYFDVNMTIIHPSDYHIIDDAAIFLKKDKTSHIIIEGNADSSGPEAANEGLSDRRAIAVKEQLEKRGISTKRMKTRGFGSREPAATNATKEGKRENRRAIIKITPAN